MAATTTSLYPFQETITSSQASSICSGLIFREGAGRSISSTSSTIGTVNPSGSTHSSILVDLTSNGPPPPPPRTFSPPAAPVPPPPPTDHEGNLWTAITVFAVITAILLCIILTLLACLCLSQKPDSVKSEVMPMASQAVATDVATGGSGPRKGGEMGGMEPFPMGDLGAEPGASSGIPMVAAGGIAYAHGGAVVPAQTPPVDPPPSYTPTAPASTNQSGNGKVGGKVDKGKDVIQHMVHSSSSTTSGGESSYSSGYSS